jgi:hypothetical protein
MKMIKPYKVLRNGKMLAKIMPDYTDLIEIPEETENMLTDWVIFHKDCSHWSTHDLDLSEFKTSQEVLKYLCKEYSWKAYKPIYLYDHSGITISTGDFSHIDSQGWDWGLAGFVGITEEVLKKYLNNSLDKAYNRIEKDVDYIDKILIGDVWAVIITELYTVTVIDDRTGNKTQETREDVEEYNEGGVTL